jgi:trk/ktr system potassium uptake protein
MRVAIAGAGRVGQAIATELLEGGHQVILLERYPNELAAARRHIVDAEFLLADACEVRSLSPAKLATCDAAVAATGEDQVNLVFSLLARQEYGIPRVVARVNDPRNSWLFTEAWGVDVAVSAPSLLASAALEAVGPGGLVQLLSLPGERVRLCSLRIREGHPALDRPVKELSLPMGAVLSAILREGALVPSDPDQIVGLGDELLLFIDADAEEETARALTGDAAIRGRGEEIAWSYRASPPGVAGSNV